MASGADEGSEVRRWHLRWQSLPHSALPAGQAGLVSQRLQGAGRRDAGGGGRRRGRGSRDRLGAGDDTGQGRDDGRHLPGQPVAGEQWRHVVVFYLADSRQRAQARHLVRHGRLGMASNALLWERGRERMRLKGSQRWGATDTNKPPIHGSVFPSYKPLSLSLSSCGVGFHGGAVNLRSGREGCMCCSHIR